MRYKGASDMLRAPVGMRCLYCRAVLTRETATWDHLIPHAAGGPTRAYNLVSCCVRCNRNKKDDMPPSGLELGDLSDFMPRDEHYRLFFNGTSEG